MALGTLQGRRSLCGALRDRELFGSKSEQPAAPPSSSSACLALAVISR